MSPPPVTSTTVTTVLPRPVYPPLPIVAPLRLPGITPPPGPDIRQMIPTAPAQVQAANKLEPLPAATAENVSGGGDFASEWRIGDLFYRPPGVINNPRLWPPADALTLYLMALVCRLSYQPESALRDAARDAILGVMGEGWTHTVITSPSAPELRYDLWRRPNQWQILAIQGSSTFAEWFRFAMPTLDVITGVATDARVYNGVQASSIPFRALLTADATGAGPNALPTVLTGHSLGGAVAQLMTGYINGAFKVLQPQANTGFPALSQYTFGAPAWISDGGSQIPNGWLDSHVRCFLPGDPVPFATQLAMAHSFGLDPGVNLLFGRRLDGLPVTRHLANKHIALEDADVTARTRYRDAIWQGLLDQGVRLTQALVSHHAIASYTAACYFRCVEHTHTSPELLAKLVTADRLMDRADSGLIG